MSCSPTTSKPSNPGLASLPPRLRLRRLAETHPLTYTELDGIGFAAERGRFDPTRAHFVAHELGPVFELGLLARSRVIKWPGNSSWLIYDGLAPLGAALSSRSRQWICPTTRSSGVYRCRATPEEESDTWVQFSFAAQAAAIASGFGRDVAAQLVGALGEMQSNIHEHSQQATTGVVAFRGTPGVFEFVVCDRGIGVLKSLQACPAYSSLVDHGQALKLTLSDGVSRFGPNSGRGLGFRPLFTGLANLNGLLRFRSGDYALTIEGRNPGAIPSKLGQKPTVHGFLASVTCNC